MKPVRYCLSLLIFAVSLYGEESTALDIQSDRASGVYRVGETVTWTVSQTDEGSVIPAELSYVFKAGGATEVKAGLITLIEGEAVLTSEFVEPNTMLLEVSWERDDEMHHVFSGAVAAPDQIQPSVEEPEDFDEFWADKIAELGTVPMNAQLTPTDVDEEGVEYSHITMDGFRGSQIHGQIARPKNGLSELPALLRVQWAGVYGLKEEWVTTRATAGWLALNILAHDLPIDEAAEFYNEQREGPLNDYFRQGNVDRETSYFLRMYLSCYRAVEYLKSRPDWDGRTIVVTGTSQGGQQAFVTAGLHPDITAAMALVPAGADFHGGEKGRAVGFPYWPANQGAKDATAIAGTGGYFDIVNFAKRIRAPMLIGVGLEDLTCPPAGVFAAINQLKTYHETVILPDSGHQNVEGSQGAFVDRLERGWLPALKAGLTAPSYLDRNGDHALLRDKLGITEMRPGANPNSDDPSAAPNYDEVKAHPYPDTPDALIFDDGSPVMSAVDWPRRREELLAHFENDVYGHLPANVPEVNWSVESEVAESKGGVDVVTKQLIGRVDNSAYSFLEVELEMTLTVPVVASGAVPVMLHFGWPPAILAMFPRTPGPTWEEYVLQHGWAAATLVPTSFQADNGEGLTQGIIGLTNHGQPRSPEQWGALRAWGWGASRALDYFESDPSVDATRSAMEGLSRYGKAAAVAMAFEPRFSVGFIGSSGKGGLAMHRRNFGEWVENLTGTYAYHWMAGNYLKYGSLLTPDDLPVDSHQLVALFAPRPAFVSVGNPDVEGQWIDQRGTFEATAGAASVYELLGKQGLGTDEYPGTGPALISGELAWRQHEGGHTTLPNWPVFLEWADPYLSAPLNDHWVGTWSTAPQLTEDRNEPLEPQFRNATVRQRFLTSIGGDAFRVHFSNIFGDAPLTIDEAAVAMAGEKGRIEAGSSVPLTFSGGQSSLTIQPGAGWYSDVVDMPLEPMSHLAVTIRTTDAPDGLNGHPGSRTTSYFAYNDEAVAAPDLTHGTPVDHWYFLTGVDVRTSDSGAAAIAILGDSITDGRGSTTNGNDRWPDRLSERLREQQETANIAVLNQGIGGNAVLIGGLGPNMIARLDRDVIAQAGVKWLVILEGINDLGGGRSSAAELIAAYDQTITRADAHGIKVYGATITPFGECFYWSEAGETKRQEINTWIRHSGRFDAVLDFDQVVRDPENLGMLLPAFDTGDHLHLNTQGLDAIAGSIDLTLFDD